MVELQRRVASVSLDRFLGRICSLIHGFLCLNFCCLSFGVQDHSELLVTERRVPGLFFFHITRVLFFGSLMTHAIIFILNCICVNA